ncbi:phage virion morphogenesis protein [Neisseria sp. Ec49-e6-T10]|uniref:phage virion morphogenesis protein n=1 Tax=Neisseria sp. Ec49-e6-T10 TaxID=3140744 RepID=UPI003EBBC9DC
MEVSIKITVDQLTNTLDKLSYVCTNREPLMLALSEQLLDCVYENFDQNGRPAWKGTARGGSILQDSGRLKASITTDHDNNTAKVGTNVVYAAIHQFGGKTKPHKILPKRAKALKFGNTYAKSVNHPGSDIPARPFLSVTDGDIQELQETIEDYILNAIE